MLASFQKTLFSATVGDLRTRQPKLKLTEFRILFLIVALVLALIAASPALSLISLTSDGERFSELWLLGPEHKAENYPFNVSVNEEYNIYVGVGNQLDALAYYAVYVKLSNQTNLLPNSTAAEPGLLPPLYEFSFALSDGQVWEAPLTFSVDYVFIQRNVTLNNVSIIQQLATLNTISINGNTFPVNYTSIWDPDKNGFYFQIFFELWLYNVNSSNFEYHNRAVRLLLNMTDSN
jgi:uncharacterized membrane protein